VNHFQQIRAGQLISIPNGGWHFSFMGDVENTMYKIENQCENLGVPEESVIQAREGLADPLCRDTRSYFVGHTPLEELPQHVRDNTDKFNKHLHQLK
jgi:hypothetical protein